MKFHHFYPFLLIFLLIFSGNAQTQSVINYQWVTVAPQQQLIIRAIVPTPHCPMVTWKNHEISYQQSLQLRHQSSVDFPRYVCEKNLPITAQNIYLAKNPLPALPPHPTRIAIIGDTGCRLKKGTSPQNCNNIKHWPFALIAQRVAAWHPQMIIHVGDYLYRESPCPAHQKICKNTPYGDNWNTWQADFFKPAQPLFKIAPLLLVRGNHESCERAGPGWNLLLNPFPFSPCKEKTPLYFVDFGNTRLFVIDSANASDIAANHVSEYKNDLITVQKNTIANNWLITHKPFWFIHDEKPLTQLTQAFLSNTLQAAWSQIKPKNLQLLVAGHVHRFEILNFIDPNTRPSQLIVGTGGAYLAPPLHHSQLANAPADGELLHSGVALSAFGFLTAEQQTNQDWKIIFHPLKQSKTIECTLHHQQLNCPTLQTTYN